MNRKPVALLVAALVMTPAIARASSSLTVGFQDRRLAIDTGLLAALDPIDNDQTSLRATWSWDVSDKLTLIAQGGAASSFLELTDVRLNGLTDIRARVLYRPTPDWAVGFGSILPAGLYELSANELTTGQWTWNPRSGFPLGSFGEGWGWEATLARGIALSENVTAGLAGSWLQHAEFSLLEGDFGKYRIGTEVGISGAIGVASGEGRRFRLMGAYKFFGPDQLDGVDHVDQGNQVELGVGIDAPLGGLRTSWIARAVLKSDNTLYTGTGIDSLLQLSQAPGTYLSFYGRAARPIGDGTSLFLEATLANVSGSEYVIGADGTTLSIGPGFGWRASSHVSLSGRVAYITGSGDRPHIEGIEDDTLTYTGTDVLFTVEIRP